MLWWITGTLKTLCLCVTLSGFRVCFSSRVSCRKKLDLVSINSITLRLIKDPNLRKLTKVRNATLVEQQSCFWVRRFWLRKSLQVFYSGQTRRCESAAAGFCFLRSELNLRADVWIHNDLSRPPHPPTQLFSLLADRTSSQDTLRRPISRRDGWKRLFGWAGPRTDSAAALPVNKSDHFSDELLSFRAQQVSLLKQLNHH